MDNFSLSDNAGNTIVVTQEGEQVIVGLSYFDNQALPSGLTLPLHDLMERLIDNRIAS